MNNVKIIQSRYIFDVGIQKKWERIRYCAIMQTKWVKQLNRNKNFKNLHLHNFKFFVKQKECVTGSQ